MTLHTHHSMKKRGHSDHKSKLHKYTSGGKAPSHPDADADKTMMRKAFHAAAHSVGEPKERLPYATGGAAKPRLDRPGRAKGGKAKGKAGNKVNIVIAGHGPGASGPPTPPVPGAMAAPRPPMAPPAAPPVAPPGVPPGAGPGMMPPRPPMGAGAPPPMMPPRAKGGRVAKAKGGAATSWMHAGAKSGIGRLEKAKHEGSQNKGPDHGETEHYEDEPAVGLSHGGRKRKSGGKAY